MKPVMFYAGFQLGLSASSNKCSHFFTVWEVIQDKLWIAFPMTLPAFSTVALRAISGMREDSEVSIPVVPAAMR